MRSIWSGDIAFGLVTIPVKLFPATRDLTPRFHLVHAVCGTRVETARRCPTCGRDVPWAEIEKGNEVARGKYARFTKEEIARVEADQTKGTVEIVEFVEPREVDLAYVEKSYWIAPSGKTARSFVLFRAVLEKTGRVALGKVALRSRTRLALLRPRDGLFSLDVLRFADELVPGDELTVPGGAAPSDKELSLARTLVLSLAAPFDPGKHPDEYRARVVERAEQKAAAHEVGKEVGPEGRARKDRQKPVDLTDLLARSLEAKRARPARAARTRAERVRPHAGAGRR